MCSAVLGCQVSHGFAVTVHCKAHSMQPFDRLAGSLTELIGWGAALKVEQLGVCMAACAWLLACCLPPCSPAMSCHVSAGRVSSTSARVTLLSLASSRQAVNICGSDRLAHVHCLEATAHIRHSPGRQDPAREVSVQRSDGLRRAESPSLPAWHLYSRLEASGNCRPLF